MAFINPLDLQQLFVNTFAGSMELFIILSFFAIIIMAAYFRMNNTIALIMLGLFGVMMALYSPEFYFLVVFVAGIGIYYSVRSFIQK